MAADGGLIRLGYEYMPIDCPRFFLGPTSGLDLHIASVESQPEPTGCVHTTTEVGGHVAGLDVWWEFALCEHHTPPVLLLGPVHERSNF